MLQLARACDEQGHPDLAARCRSLATEHADVARETERLRAEKTELSAQAALANTEVTELEHRAEAVKKKAADLAKREKHAANIAWVLKWLAIETIGMVIGQLGLVQTLVTTDALGGFYRWAGLDAAHTVCATLVFLVIGGAGYLMRTSSRYHYGAIELAASIVAVWCALHEPKTNAVPESLTIMGAVYFMIRGIDNLVVGFKERQNALRAEVAQAQKDAVELAKERERHDVRVYVLKERIRRTRASLDVFDSRADDAKRKIGKIKEETNKVVTFFRAVPDSPQNGEPPSEPG